MGELLAEQGVEGATVGSISGRAGVSRRTFYEVFEDREECFLAAFEQAIERIAQKVTPAYVAKGKWSARIRAALVALLEYFDERPGIARMLVVETLRAGPKVLERRGRVLSALTAAVDEGRTESKRDGTPLPLAAEGVVGGALAVVHARLLADDGGRLVELVNPLTGMILHSYLGPAAARRELDRSLPKRNGMGPDGAPKDPFKDLTIRFTYRTARVLAAIAAEDTRESPLSNRLIADTSGIADEGQMSRLLRRLERAGLIENQREGHLRGEPNAWSLTPHGQAVHTILTGT